MRDIVVARDHGGYSPEEIAAAVYPGLSLGEVYAALGYYEDHRAEINTAAAAEEEAVLRFQQAHPNLVVSLQPIQAEP